MYSKQIQKSNDIIVHDFDRRIENEFMTIQSELSPKNVEIIKKYDMEMVRGSLSKATRLKHIATLLSLTRILKKDWDTVTKQDIDQIIYEVITKYSPNGQETHTTWDHKKILKIFFRWFKLGSRDSKAVGDPEETKHIRLKPVKNRIVREQLITENDLSALLKACVGINYHSGLFPIKNYEAVGFFIDKDGNQGQNIKVTLDQINPNESKELVFVNTVSGFVSEFKMQMLGGKLVTEPTPQPPQNLPSEATVQITPKSSNPGCEKTNACYKPYSVNLNVGGKVTWYNNDGAVHTVTNSNLDPYDENYFDSGLIIAGKEYSHKFSESGTFEYYCQVHPWAKGAIVVGNGIPPKPEPVPSNISAIIEVDQPWYRPNDYMIISGDVTGLSEGITLDIVIFDPNGKQIGGKGKVTVNQYGRFIENSQVGIYTVDGTYKMQLQYKQKTLAETTFDIYLQGKSSPQPDQNTPNKPHIKITKSYYVIGDTIVISGKLDSTSENKPLIIQIFRDDDRINIGQADVLPDGTFTHTVLADGPYFTKDGKYIVQVNRGALGDVYELSFDFYVKNKPPTYAAKPVIKEITTKQSPTQNPQTTQNHGNIEFKIQSKFMITLDKNPPKYNSGDIVTISGSGLGKTQTTFIKIFDPANNEIEELSMISTNVGTFQIPWLVPLGLKPGVYTIQVQDLTQLTEETVKQPSKETISKEKSKQTESKTKDKTAKEIEKNKKIEKAKQKAKERLETLKAKKAKKSN